MGFDGNQWDFMVYGGILRLFRGRLWLRPFMFRLQNPVDKSVTTDSSVCRAVESLELTEQRRQVVVYGTVHAGEI